MSATAGIAVERPANGVMLIAVERDEVLNAIDVPSCTALDEALAAAAADADVRAIVLTGRGGRAFSAGFDIHEMGRFDADEMRDAFRRRDPITLRVAEHRCPVIAAVDGICYGAGALIALASDIRIATPGFRLKVTAVGYGGANATWSLPAIVGEARAKEILMTGRVVAADEALAIGLVNRIVAADTIEAEAVSLAETIAGHPPAGVQAIKQLVDMAGRRSVSEGWQAEHDWMFANTNFAPGGGNGFAAFRGRRTRAAPDHIATSPGEE